MQNKQNTNVLIGGGSGLIGSRLSHLLSQKGYNVAHLSRTASNDSPYRTYLWDARAGSIEDEAIVSADYIINLAGAGIADERWTDQRKQSIINSRVDTTRLLYQSWERLQSPPKAFISAAAMGYYGDRSDYILYEENMPGGGFLPVSCIAWEKAIKEAAQTGVRTVWLRTGIVLSTEGGALPKMIMPLSFGINTYFGNGKQWYSWVHLDDMCQMYIHAIENDNMQGAYNAASPNPLRNRAFAKTIADAAGKSALLIPAPSFALRLALGEMADTVLSSTRMSVEKLLKSGFLFTYPTLQAAATDLLQH